MTHPPPLRFRPSTPYTFTYKRRRVATALSRNASLVTRKLREFGRVQGLKVVDWHG